MRRWIPLSGAQNVLKQRDLQVTKTLYALNPAQDTPSGSFWTSLDLKDPVQTPACEHYALK
jgi:hypothetical protein